MQKIKNEGQRLENAIERTPSIIEEAAEMDELGESGGPKVSGFDKKPGQAAIVEGSKSDNNGDEDFDFELPDKLQPLERDSTMVKKRKNEMADVLGEIAKATSFVD